VKMRLIYLELEAQSMSYWVQCYLKLTLDQQVKRIPLQRK